MSEHCADNFGDRALGETWERHFGELAGRHGKFFTPHQIGREGPAAAYRRKDKWEPVLLPDVTVWSSPGEHHEVKHKRATRWGGYGLEAYRLAALVAFATETDQRVLYTIHDWGLAGATDSRASMPNDIAHWRSADVLRLDGSEQKTTSPGKTYYAGQEARTDICYWPVDEWAPLLSWWPERVAA